MPASFCITLLREGDKLQWGAKKTLISQAFTIVQWDYKAKVCYPWEVLEHFTTQEPNELCLKQ